MTGQEMYWGLLEKVILRHVQDKKEIVIQTRNGKEYNYPKMHFGENFKITLSFQQARLESNELGWHLFAISLRDFGNRKLYPSHTVMLVDKDGNAEEYELCRVQAYEVIGNKAIISL